MTTEASKGSPKSGFQRIAGKLEPWEFWMLREIAVEFRSRVDQKGVAVLLAKPDADGIFVFDVENKSEASKALRSGNAEIHAVTANENSVGYVLTPPTDSPLIDVLIHIKVRVPEVNLAIHTLTAPNLITSTKRSDLVELLAHLQGVGKHQVKAPSAVVSAITELNSASLLAVRALAGDRGAAVAMRFMLQDVVPDTIVGGTGDHAARFVGRKAAMITAFHEFPDLKALDRGCLVTTSRVLDIMQAGFNLDFVDGHREPEWTFRASAYTRIRLHTFNDYFRSARRWVEQGAGGSEFFPDGFQDFVPLPLEPDLPGGIGSALPPEWPGSPASGSRPEEGPPPAPDLPDFCEMVREMCMSLFKEASRAALADELVELIASIENQAGQPANCLCSNYDPNQIFFARPKQGRAFPVDPATNSLPSGVELRFGSRTITPLAVAPDQIRFRIPSGSFSGPVYLRLLGVTPSQAAREFASACARVIPELPSGVLLNRSPGASISIIYPPVVASLTGNGRSGDLVAESCQPARICWGAHLSDQVLTDTTWPCGSIRLKIVEEVPGSEPVTVVDTTSQEGCFLVTAEDDRVYRAEAVSYAGQTECGKSATASLRVRRVPRIYLSLPPNITREVPGASGGRIVVTISCPAPKAGVTIQLFSSSPQALQMPSSVTLPWGASSVEVQFTTQPGVCQKMQLTAAATGYVLDDHLDIIVYRDPVLQWVGAAPRLSLCQTVSMRVSADCLPDDLSRIQWSMVSPIGPSGFVSSVRLQASRASTPNQYVLTIPEVERDRFSMPGTWSLTVQVRDRVGASNALKVAVIGGAVSGSLSSPQPLFEVCLPSTDVRVEWTASAVQSIRLLLDDDLVHQEGSPASPLTDRCGSTNGAQWLLVAANGARIGSQKELKLQGLPYDGGWQTLATRVLTGWTDAPGPVDSALAENYRAEKVYIYIVGNYGMSGPIEAPAGGNNNPSITSITLPDCETVLLVAYTENPPREWPPVGQRKDLPWKPKDPQWVVDWGSPRYQKAVSHAITKVPGAPLPARFQVT